MRLHDFILTNLESILQAWEDFARSVETPLPAMTAKQLRNHAEFMLRTVAADMGTFQSEQQQISKSHGHGPVSDHDTAAQTHATGRLVSGFTMDQMVSEYRALRSSVLRLWLAEESARDHYQLQDMIRFNEAIDQALVESVEAYGQAVQETRKTVLAVLGHDLRSPLGAVLMAGELLQRNHSLGQRERHLANQICSSANRANRMVLDLLDLARCNLGTGIPVHLEPTDLSAVCNATLEELRTAHPTVQIVAPEIRAVTGQFDSSRMAQVFSNLIVNAIRHGGSREPIIVSLIADAGEARFTVQNQGEPIPANAMPYLFNPEGRFSTYATGEKGASAGLGLGLFIASQIVENHGGRITVESGLEAGTTFHVWLPLR